MANKTKQLFIPKTGRPTGFSREKAIISAMNLFWRKGFLGVSAKDLAESMAIQRSSFYNSFGSKEAVFTESLNLYTQLTPDTALKAIKSGEPVMPVVIQMLRKLCRIRAEDSETRGCLVCNSIAELQDIGEKNGDILKETIEQKTALVQKLLLQAAAQQEIKLNVDVENAARTFITFLIGLNMLAKVIPDEAKLWAICEHFLSGFNIADDTLINVSQKCQ